MEITTQHHHRILNEDYSPASSRAALRINSSIVCPVICAALEMSFGPGRILFFKNFQKWL